MRFIRRFARENPLLVAIYSTAACYAVVYISMRTVIYPGASTKVVRGDQDARGIPPTEYSPPKDPLQRIVHVMQSVVKAQGNISSHSNKVDKPVIVPYQENNDKHISNSGFPNSSQILKSSLVNTISKKLDDYDYQISLPFLQNYLNPCWYEEMNSAKGLYVNNAFITKLHNKNRNFLESMAKDAFEMRVRQGEHWRLRCLPYFYIIGMAKCGTTDLWDEISSHPQVHPGLMKEYHWWSRARIDTDTPIREYIDLFDIAAEKIRTACVKNHDTERKPPNRCVTGESTVSTCWHCKRFVKNENGLNVPPDPTHMTPGLMHRLQPNAKLILILRDPVTRLFSDYVFFSTRKSTLGPDDFHKRCTTAIRQMNECFNQYDLRTCVHSADLHKNLPIEIFKSIYVVFLRDWLAIWPRDQLLILHMETYSQQRAVTMETVFDYLELEPMTDTMRQKIENKPKANTMKKTSNIGHMKPETEVMLRQFFQPFNNELAELIGDDRYKWS